MEDKITINVFKYFGSSDKLKRTLESLSSNCKFTYDIRELHGDNRVECVYNGDFTQCMRLIMAELKDGIYNLSDMTLSQTLFEMLKIRNMRISVAESFTSGRVVNEIIKNSGASEVVNEGIVCYSNLAKIKRLGVKEETLNIDGAVSSSVAGQMVTGLLKTGDCDIALSTTGIAGPKSDNTLKPVGLCYLGVGTNDGIHVYKYNFSGDREEITETAKNACLFHAIKNIK